MKIIIIGGHITPALAVIDALEQKAEIVFLGRKYSFEGDKAESLEYQTIRKRGIKFITITTGRLQRSFSHRSLISFIKVPYAVVQSLRILQKEKPNVVVGFGGYVSVPICLAASLLKIPIVIHEQTLGAGLANKFISRFAAKVCVSWKQSLKYFPEEKTVITGNPLRKFVNDSSFALLKSESQLPLLFITGGSTGAHFINVLIEGCLEELLRRFRIIHQTGDSKEFGDFNRLQLIRDTLPLKFKERYELVKFINPEEIGEVIRRSELIVSRSGMNTVTEILYFGKPALLIPLPHGQKNEQLINAQFLKKTGLGNYKLQSELNSISLLREIEYMYDQKQKFLVHKEETKTLVPQNSADKIIQIIYEVVEKKKS